MERQAFDNLPSQEGHGLDSNQRQVADRLFERLSVAHPIAPPDQLMEWAEHQAILDTPTVRKAALSIVDMREGRSYVYVAFFGRDDTCQFVKVGMSRHPEKRVYDLQTGNPLDLLALYAAEVDSRIEAYANEHAIHRSLKKYSRRGEWFDFGEFAVGEAPRICHQIATSITKTGLNFQLLSVAGEAA